jgi:hypothetical protein
MGDQPNGASRAPLKVFLCWSGDRSLALAKALIDWLPTVVQGCELFLSARGIKAGDPWREKLATNLETMHFGIICITRDNAYAPWLLFEAGALSKRHQQADARVVPFFLDDPVRDSHPLGGYQGKSADKPGTLELLNAVWDACGGWLGDGGVALRKELFERRWPALEAEIARVRQLPEALESKGWSASIPRSSKSDRGELKRVRVEIRDHAAAALSKALDREPDEVRVNVFFLDVGQARDGILELRMDQGLLPENREFDESVAFRQNQGLTGSCFQHRCMFGAWGDSPPGGDDWQLTDFGAGHECRDAALNIGDKRQKALAPKMRWILSFPLLPPASQTWPLGVLNIDGFDVLPNDQPSAEKVFKEVEQAVQEDLRRFIDILQRSPRERLRLLVD